MQKESPESSFLYKKEYFIFFLCLRHPKMVSLLKGLWMMPPRHLPSTAIPIMTVTYLVRLSVYSWVASTRFR